MCPVLSMKFESHKSACHTRPHELIIIEIYAKEKLIFNYTLYGRRKKNDLLRNFPRADRDVYCSLRYVQRVVFGASLQEMNNM